MSTGVRKRGISPVFGITFLFADFPVVLAFSFDQADFAVFGFIAALAGVQDDAFRQVGREDFGFFLVLGQDDVYGESIIGRGDQPNVGDVDLVGAMVEAIVTINNRLLPALPLLFSILAGLIGRLIRRLPHHQLINMNMNDSA